MNEQSIKLIEQLAQKLGTTTQYIWSILINQAPIDATIALFKTLCVILFGVILWKIHYRLTEDNNYDETSAVLMAIGVATFIILSVICFCVIGDIVNGYFNPEYWALEKILHQCR